MEPLRHHSGAGESAGGKSLWRQSLDLLEGHPQDYTRGPLPRSVLLLAVPMVFEMLMEAVFGVVDIFFVAHLGPEAVEAVGITESVLTLVFGVAVGLSVAATALVARHAGAGNMDEAAKVACQAIGLGILASLVTALLGGFGAADILRFMGASQAGIEIGTSYAAWLFGGSITIYLLFLINAIFRGVGDALLALKALWLANLVNLVLDPLLIFGWGPFPELGLTGAGIATNIGRGVGIAFQLWALLGGRGRLRLDRRSLTFESRRVRQILTLASTAAVQSLIGTASWLGLMRILAFLGPTAVAGYTIALRVVVFAILPSWGLCNAAATLVGQNLGARKPRRAEHAVWVTGFVNLVFLSVVGLVFVLAAEPLIRLFTDDIEVLKEGTSALRWISYSFVFYAYAMVITQAYNGAGDTYTPTYVAFVVYWLLQIPLALGLSLGLGFGAAGVFAAVPISEAVRAALCLHLFRRGSWKSALG